ncbi:MAG: Gfo/Idh/MocA family oxidoreductase, partial [Clostridia bacterium]|nr:Gfo/Idh/MocA family oxidoreductase [Clostridia bacterium]
AAVIETTDKYLTKYALDFAKAGMAIQMDKPGGLDQGEYEELFDLCEKKKVPIQTGYMYRFNPSVKKLYELYDSGRMGEIFYINAEMNCFHPKKKREWLADYPGGMLYFLGCHLIDVIFRLQGEPEEVIPLSASTGTDGVKSADCGFAAFRYKKGCSFARSTAVERGGFMRRQIVAVGEKAAFEIKPTEYNFKGYSKELLQSDSVFVTDANNWAAIGEKTSSEPYDRYVEMFRSFYDIATGRKENPYGAKYEKDLHRLILKACGALK